jgi:tetratricopeptide (TPR) repeat protein
LNLIGWQQAHLDDHLGALGHCEQALVLAQATGDVNGQAHTWDSLGHIRHHLGHYQQALDCYRQAVELFHATGERNSEANCLVCLGDSHHSAHQPGAAHDAWTRALAITVELGLPDDDPVRTTIRHRLSQAATPGMPSGMPSGHTAV